MKLLLEGFTIIREREVGIEAYVRNRKPIISAKTIEMPEWHHYKIGFPSKAARRRAMNKLLELSTVIED